MIEASNITMIAVTMMFGMFVGAGLMFRIMLRDTTKLEKELDFKTKLLQNRNFISEAHSEEFTKKEMIEFAKFNTKHYKGMKNVQDKLELFKTKKEKENDR